MICILTNGDCIPILKFLCCLVFKNRPKFYFVVFCSMCLKMSERGLFLVNVPHEVMKCILSQAGFGNDTDTDNCIIVSSKHLLEPFNTNKIPCWVQLCLCQNKKESENVRLALAVGLPSANGTVMIVSDVLCYNIKKSIMLRGTLCLHERPRMKFHIVTDSPKFAQSLEMSLVKETFGPIKEVVPVEALINSFFKIPRYVHAGDILCISGPNDLVAHSAVVRVQGNSISSGFLVQVEKTKINQGSEMNFYVPTYPVFLRTLKNTYPITAANFKEFLIDKCPPWLHLHAMTLSTCLLPFLPIPDGLDLIGPPGGRLPVILVSGPQGSGKRTIITAALRGASGVWEVGSLHQHTHDCSALRGTGPGSIEKTLTSILANLSSAALCLLVLYNIEWIAMGRDGPDEGRGIESWLKWLADLRKQCRGVIAVVATTRCRQSDLPASLARTFIEEISLHESPDTSGRENMIRWMLRLVGATHHEWLPRALAQHTAGFIYGDLQALISGTLRKKYLDVRNSCSEAGSIFLEEEDFEKTLDKMNMAYSDAIGAPKIPSVFWEDVGGLAGLREEILTTIELPVKHPELLLAGLKRTGILLYGPPGTGKTLLAKAVATECNFNFISVKGPELLNMYVGQSEANVREVFQRARSAMPCIIFFDELDSLAPNRGRTGDSGGVMDRVVSQLLAEMDGQQKVNNVFIMGATNRPDLVDPALLRPGRFDKILYIGPYEDKHSQLSVMTALTRKFSFAPDVSLEAIVALFPERMSGADMQAVCTGAMVSAMEREVVKADLAGEADQQSDAAYLLMYMEDFYRSLRVIKPSISASDLLHFKKLSVQFEK